jgi:hypothetical protein
MDDHEELTTSETHAMLGPARLRFPRIPFELDIERHAGHGSLDYPHFE